MSALPLRTTSNAQQQVVCARSLQASVSAPSSSSLSWLRAAAAAALAGGSAAVGAELRSVRISVARNCVRHFATLCACSLARSLPLPASIRPKATALTEAPLPATPPPLQVKVRK